MIGRGLPDLMTRPWAVAQCRAKWALNLNSFPQLVIVQRWGRWEAMCDASRSMGALKCHNRPLTRSQTDLGDWTSYCIHGRGTEGSVSLWVLSMWHWSCQYLCQYQQYYKRIVEIRIFRIIPIFVEYLSPPNFFQYVQQLWQRRHWSCDGP